MPSGETATLFVIPRGSTATTPSAADTPAAALSRPPEREAEAILDSAVALLAPTQVHVRTGENRIAVKFAARRC